MMDCSSVGVMKFPTEWKVIKFMVQTTNQTLIIGYKRILMTQILILMNVTNHRILGLISIILITNMGLPEV